ncbi:MAG: hypothetical protein JXR70_14370 [Spirochaetales bacterium]|nr:hypothetical protein [Spirochaetales bacterium]
MKHSLAEKKVNATIFILDLNKMLPRIPNKNIREALGYTGALPPGMEEMIDTAFQKALESCHIQAGYGLFPVEHLSSSILKIGNYDIKAGTQITPRLKQAEKLALFTATLGPEIEKWTTVQATSDNPAQSYIIDIIASLLAEESAALLHQHLADKMKKSGYSVSNRYSPGYCGWDVNEQKILFQLLPKSFCGITLGDSAFMCPRKSVSGIIGIGKNIKYQDYNCQRCKNKLCHLAAKQKELKKP